MVAYSPPNNTKALSGEGLQVTGPGCLGALQGVDVNAPDVTHYIFHDLGNAEVQFTLPMISLVAFSPGAAYCGFIEV